MTTEERRSARSEKYSEERADSLSFNTPEKSDRYRTERFPGAIGLNWFDCDPTLQRAMRYYLTAEEYAWAGPRLTGLGELMGGLIAERAELTDKNPPRLVKYDRWGHDVSEVIIAESAKQTKRDLVQNGFIGPKFRRDAEAANVNAGPLAMASGYLLNQAEIGMSCAMGADAGMVESQVARFAPQSHLVMHVQTPAGHPDAKHGAVSGREPAHLGGAPADARGDRSRAARSRAPRVRHLSARR